MNGTASPLSERYAYARKANLPLTRLQSRTIAEVYRALADRRLEFAAPSPCLLCGERGHRLLAERDRYGLPVRTVVCEGCGLLRSDPVLTPPSLASFYASHYRALHEGRSAAAGAAARFARPRRNGRRVLGRLQESGQAFGLARGLELLQGEAPAALAQWLAGRGLKADVVILRHVVEHLVDPAPFLRQLQPLLGTRGVLYVEVPGLRMLAEGKKGYDFLSYLMLPHYERTTLERLLAQAGYASRSCNEEIWGVFEAMPSSVQAPAARRLDATEVIEFLRHVEGLRQRHRRPVPWRQVRDGARRVATTLGAIAVRGGR